jgi:hypothetical protein
MQIDGKLLKLGLINGYFILKVFIIFLVFDESLVLGSFDLVLRVFFNVHYTVLIINLIIIKSLFILLIQDF